MSMTSLRAKPRTDGDLQHLRRRDKHSDPCLVTREFEVGARRVLPVASRARLSRNTMAYARGQAGMKSGDCFNPRVGRSPRRFALGRSYRYAPSTPFVAVKLPAFGWAISTGVTKRLRYSAQSGVAFSIIRSNMKWERRLYGT